MSLARLGAIASVGAAALYAIPYAGYVLYPVLLVATLLHELAHALVAAASGGRVSAITLDGDGGAVTLYRGGAAGWVAMAGPLAPAIVGAALIAVAPHRRALRIVALSLGALVGLGALAWLRGALAIAVAVAIVVALVVIAYAPGRWSQRAVLCVGPALALAWLARRAELWSSTATGPAGVVPSDTATIAHDWGATITTWATVIAATSLVALLAAFAATARTAR